MFRTMSGAANALVAGMFSSSTLKVNRQHVGLMSGQRSEKDQCEGHCPRARWVERRLQGPSGQRQGSSTPRGLRTYEKGTTCVCVTSVTQLLFQPLINKGLFPGMLCLVKP